MELTETINSLERQPASSKASGRNRKEQRKPLGDLKALAIVVVACLLPILALGAVAMLAQQASLANARAEIREQALGMQITRFVNAVMTYQRYTAQGLFRDLSVRGSLDRVTDEANAAVAAIDSANEVAGNELGTENQWNEVKNLWRQLSFVESDDAQRAPDLHRSLVKALGEFSITVAARRGELQEKRVQGLQRQELEARVIGSASAAIALLVLLVVGARMFGSARQRKSQAALAVANNQRDEAAILRMMDELSVIASGDLTAQTQVTEEITGAIADSVNVTVGQLKRVVRDINLASDKVTGATEQAQLTSRQLIADTIRQAEDIEAADVSVEMMTQSMSEVSQSANESADVARRSLASTERGSQAVQDSIGGMNEIRQQIQETAKRIKRLGESSQEIGEIVDVITDIAEQTNVLSLNAAIQAAAAGEAGRAFSVVAEEVQLLAERSAEATTQIAGLVRAIQTDTLEAAAAMESSIQGVVEGARLSDTAGRSLREIETVTRDLTEMIQRIAVNTETQVVVAEEVRKIMRDVLQVTGSTTEGTQSATTSVTEIADQAMSLKSSVAQFKVA